MVNIAVLVSGGGTNLQALMDKIHSGFVQNARIAVVIASNDRAYAIKRAENNNIPCKVISRNSFSDSDAFDQAMLDVCKEYDIQLVVLAGYLSMLGKGFVSAYENRILNIHPSLIPSFCGKGYYGIVPHRKALEYGVKITGATVHFIDFEYDSGPIVLQKPVEVKEDDTPETLQNRVMEEAEWEILPLAVKLFCEDRLKVVGRKVTIMP
jgi:phosphoribosylglycinamide formyltransferase-1